MRGGSLRAEGPRDLGPMTGDVGKRRATAYWSMSVLTAIDVHEYLLIYGMTASLFKAVVAKVPCRS